MFTCSSVLLFGAKAKAFFSFWDPERIGLYCNGIVVYGYHNRKGNKPIINTWVNTFLSGIVGFEGVYFCSKIHIICGSLSKSIPPQILYIVQKYKKKNKIVLSPYTNARL